MQEGKFFIFLKIKLELEDRGKAKKEI